MATNSTFGSIFKFLFYTVKIRNIQNNVMFTKLRSLTEKFKKTEEL